MASAAAAAAAGSGCAGTGAAASTSARIAAIHTQLPKFLDRIVYSADADFAATYPSASKTLISTELGFSAPLGSGKNLAHSVAAARKALRHSAVYLGPDFHLVAAALANMQVLTLCKKQVAFQLDTIDRHAESCTNCKRLVELRGNRSNLTQAATSAAPALRQMTLGEGSAPVVPLPLAQGRMRRAILLGSLAAGNKGSAGMPPSSIASQLDEDLRAVSELAVLSCCCSVRLRCLSRLLVLQVLRAVPAGMFPTTATIMTSDLPAAVSLLEADIASQLRKTGWAGSIDAGTTHAEGGVTVLAFCASHPVLGDFLLNAGVLRAHETAVTQATFVADTLERLSIPSRTMLCLAGDRGSVNEASVNALKVKPAFAHLEYVPCTAHGLNRIIGAIVGVANEEFNVVGDATLLRSWVVSGASTRRQQMFRAAGFRASWLDVVITRWSSVAVLMNRLVTVQKLRAPRKAAARSAAGVPSSAAAAGAGSAAAAGAGGAAAAAAEADADGNGTDDEDDEEEEDEDEEDSDDHKGILFNKLQRFVYSDEFATEHGTSSHSAVFTLMHCCLREIALRACAYVPMPPPTQRLALASTR